VCAALRQRGAGVAFDNNYRPRLWPDVAQARHWFGRFTALASTALMTLDDDMALWGQPDADAQLQATLAGPAPEVVVKRGPLPTVVRVAGQPVQAVPTEPVARVVDTTAAGDSFAGAYLAARLGGAAPAAAAAAGNRLAARVVQHHGAVIDRRWMADLLASAP
jgi:2-dehydro-3-deoxygluconokinase